MTRRNWEPVAIGAFAVVAGVFAMMGAGAATFHLVIQAATGVLGLSLVLASSGPAKDTSERLPLLVGLGGLAVMAATFLHPGVDGVHRWFGLGPVLIQPAALSLPLIVWAAWRRNDPAGAITIFGAAALCALQPDGQAALGLAVAALLLCRRGPIWWAAAAAAAGSALWAWTRPEILAPVAYVEGVLTSALDDGLAMGGVTLLALVAVPGAIFLADRRGLGLILAALWSGFALASLSGRFPTPVIGFGLSWVVGWALSLGLARR